MAGRTARFQFSVVGGPDGGSFTDDDQKFSSTDRILLDTLLTQVEGNDFHLRSTASTAPDAGTASFTTGGDLAGGTTYYYRFSLLDANGVESLASDEFSVELPAPLDAPDAPTAQMDEQSTQPTGTLPADLYYYALTAVRGTEESVLGATMMIRVTPELTAVTLGLPDLDGVDMFKVWRMGSKDPGYTMVGLANSTTFTDDGSIPADPCSCNPENLPPTGAANNQVYAVQVTVPEAGAKGWNLYRTTESGYYSASSLVATVTAFNTEDDPLSGVVTTFTDLGGDLDVGVPQDENLNMAFTPFTFDMASTVPDAAGYPDGYPLVDNSGDSPVLSMKTGGTAAPAWTPVGGGGGVTFVSSIPDPATYETGDMVVVVDDTTVTTPTLLIRLQNDNYPTWASFCGEVVAPPVVTSPSGNQFVIQVDDEGNLTTAPAAGVGPLPSTSTGLTTTWGY